MTVAKNVVDGPDWRHEKSYNYTAHLTRRGWAWEFLRRNIEFQRDLRVVLEQAKYLEKRPQFEVINSSVILTKWGGMFRGFVAARCQCILVPASMRARVAGSR